MFNLSQRKLDGALKRQAQFDYENARGTAHLRLLTQIRSRLQNMSGRLNAQMSPIKSRLLLLEQNKQASLRMTLERAIATEHLQEAPGIGPSLRQSLLTFAFRNSIKDLRYAQNRVPGIGPSRQATLNWWVDYYEQLIPQLLERDFTGKQQVVQAYEEKSKEPRAQLERLAQQQKGLEERFVVVNEKIHSLETVTVQDFYKALQNPAEANPKLEYYLRGIFAAWEPVPNWLKTLYAEVGINA